MASYTTLLTALLALLVGLAVGKAWERYKLRDGQWVDRRRQRESPHFLQGLTYLVAHQLDQAVDELNRVRQHTDSVELESLIGNLYREKGQVGRAIQIHQQLLQRPRLSASQHAHALLCLGLDFKQGGFVDRAFEAFSNVLKLEPGNAQALLGLEKLHEDQHQWAEARAVRERLAAGSPEADRAHHQSILGFLENELGQADLRSGQYASAVGHFTAALELDARTLPAYINMGDAHAARGRDAEALDAWERLVAIAPDRAHLVFERLATTYARLGTGERFPTLCRSLIAEHPALWRARLALGQHLLEHGSPRESLDTLFDALAINPHALTIHHTIWRALLQLRFDEQLVLQYIDTSRGAVFYRDPHVCVRCRYRSNDLLWQCPHCHEWNSFIEDRLTPAKDSDEAGP